jgi:hypothetical protein
MLDPETARWDTGVIFRGQPTDADFAVDAQATADFRAQLRVVGAPQGGS